MSRGRLLECGDYWNRCDDTRLYRKPKYQTLYGHKEEEYNIQPTCRKAACKRTSSRTHTHPLARLILAPAQTLLHPLQLFRRHPGPHLVQPLILLPSLPPFLDRGHFCVLLGPSLVFQLVLELLDGFQCLALGLAGGPGGGADARHEVGTSGGEVG